MLKLAFIWANELRVGLFSKTRATPRVHQLRASLAAGKPPS
jgi:hypothetical protein